MSTVNYAEVFESELARKYSRELLTADMTTENVRFMGAKTIRMPVLTLAGFQDHSRQGGFNRRDVTNDFVVKTLTHDRDVEFFVDAMDVDETNHANAAANLTNAFDEEFAIPETDAYRFSKLYADYTAAGGVVDTSAIDEGGALDMFDDFTEALDDAEAPETGRVLYVTPKTAKLLKQAAGMTRYLEMGDLSRQLRTMDGVKVVVVPANRMKTAYTFTDGFAPAAGAKQINMALIHPKSVVAVVKHSCINLWQPGEHTMGDGYLYQNRQYGDLFLIESRIGGVRMNVN